jgi:enamine deaminase RidA (YjgF/YER057c/UK114 family)
MNGSRVLFMFFAVSAMLMAQTEFPNPEGLAPANGYSHVVAPRPGRLIFVSGQVALNRKGELVGNNDLQAQTEQVFENIKTALAGAGATFEQVVKINWYVKGFKPESLAVLRQVRNRYVNAAKPPASTLVGVVALFREDCMIEVDAIAVVPDKAGKNKR